MAPHSKNVDDDHLDRLAQELMAEKDRQIDLATRVIRPIVFVVTAVAFAVSYWSGIGILLSIAVAYVSFLVMAYGIIFPIGIVLGRRAARRLVNKLESPLV